MTGRASKVGERWPRLVAVYVAVLLLGAAGLALALSAGAGLNAAPQPAPVTRVDGPAVDCLGPELVSIQSGVYLELHRPSDSGVKGGAGARAAAAAAAAAAIVTEGGPPLPVSAEQPPNKVGDHLTSKGTK